MSYLIYILLFGLWLVLLQKLYYEFLKDRFKIKNFKTGQYSDYLNIEFDKKKGEINHEHVSKSRK